MAILCEVCSSEPFKYRCPICGLTSCSLACTQSHKIYCAPKALSTAPSSEETPTQPPGNQANGQVSGEGNQEKSHPNSVSPAALGSSAEIKELLSRYPSLREQFKDIFKATLEEEWVETQKFGDKTRYFGKGRMAHRNRGPWTREKGFNRGLGKVRKYRERCEEGLETGKNAEAFVQFLTLVNQSHPEQNP